MSHKKQCPICKGTGVVEPPFGERIASLRKKRGWTQADLAAKLQIARPSVDNIEGGRQEVGTAGLVVLAHLFNVTADHLLGLDER